MRWVEVALLGALAFWAPDVLIHVIRRYAFSGLDVLLVTVLSPVALFFVLFRSLTLFQLQAGKSAIRMLMGIWVLGGLFMMIGASFSGGGFTGPGGIRDTVSLILMSLLPIYTFMMATYDGSLGALILTSLALLLMWVIGLRRPFISTSKT